MRRMMVGVLLLLLTGCTSVTAKRVKPDDYTTAGLRYYLPAPYLLVKKPVEIARSEKILVFADPFTKLEELCDKGECREAPAVPEVSDSSLAATPSPSTTPSAQSSRHKTGKGDKEKSDKGDIGKDKLEGTEKVGEQAGGDGAKVTNGPPPDPAKENEKTTEEKPKDEATGGGDSGEEAGEEGEAIQLVWLPDPCREMALQTTNNVAKLKTSITFTDGWKLTQIDAESDATDVAKELIGLAGTVIDAKKAVRIAELGGEEEEEGGGAAASQKKKVPIVPNKPAPYFLRKTTVTSLKPGLYQILVYPNQNCDEIPRLNPKILDATMDFVSYSPATKKP